MAHQTPIGDRIRNLREALGWTKAELARRSNISAALVSAYERGVSEPGYSKLLRLAHGFGVSLDHLAQSDLDRPPGDGSDCPKDAA